MNRLVIVSLAAAIAATLSGQQAQASPKEKVVYSFDGSDGITPQAGLIAVNGTLYGATNVGGRYSAGSVFSLDPATGVGTVLYSFCSRKNCPDGQYPADYSGLTDVNGTLYGTTYSGGARGMGIVFSLDTMTGVETVLYSFCSRQNCADGASPYAGLLNVNGTLYGTTYYGGDNGLGSVFAFDPATGTETVVHSFGSGADGRYPEAGLIHANGLLYGTTIVGGANDSGTTIPGDNNGYGTVFSLNPKTGAEKVVYSFCSRKKCRDGSVPHGGLIDVSGILYGTTFEGGASVTNTNCYPIGCGTVFSLDPGTGAETVLYSFCPQAGCADGEGPDSGVIAVRGILYGTTSGTGLTGGGTAYSVDPGTGSEKTLYTFCSRQNCADGTSPYAGLIDVNGTLYGTTQGGGANGDGTVFALTRTDRNGVKRRRTTSPSDAIPGGSE